MFVALERLAPALARRVDVDSLVARNELEFRCPVEVEAAVELLLAPDVEGGLARLRMGDLGQSFGKLVRQTAVLFCPGYLAEVDLTAVAKAIARVAPKSISANGGCSSRESVFELSYAAGSVTVRAAASSRREIAGVLEPPIARKSQWVGFMPWSEDEDRRRLVEPLRLLDEIAACGIDGLVDLHELVPGLAGAVCRMRWVEPVPHEVPGDVGAHEVDAQETEVGLELEGEEADVCDLLDVGPERGCSGREVLQVGGWRDARKVRVGCENGVSGAKGDDLRPARSPEPSNQDAAERLGRCVNGTVTKADRVPAAPR